MEIYQADTGHAPITIYLGLPYKEQSRRNFHRNMEDQCCLNGNLEVEYRGFEPEKLYAPVVKHSNIRVFVGKAAAQGLIVEGRMSTTPIFMEKLQEVS